MSASQPAPPPPTYSHTEPAAAAATAAADSSSSAGVQLLICPGPDAVQFQNGFLGADGERAALEGELHVKQTAQPERAFRRATIALRTAETAHSRTVELNAVEIVLFDAAAAGASSSSAAPAPALPASIPFAVPLMADAPMAVRTPVSALTHTLTATLYPADAAFAPLTASVAVLPQRYTPHTLALAPAPRTLAAAVPTEVRVELPRTTFHAGERVPVYVTVPPPPRALIVEHGLRLRNVRVELVRTIRVRTAPESSSPSRPSKARSEAAAIAAPTAAQSSTNPKAPVPPAHDADEDYDDGDDDDSDPATTTTFRTVVSRSGASCRFHTTRAVQLRLILHPPASDDDMPSAFPFTSALPLPSTSTSSSAGGAATDSGGRPGAPADRATISQRTVLHRVAFALRVTVAFLSHGAHSATEDTRTLAVPLTLLAPPAPLPEVEPAVDAAYAKKHDRPPARTVRRADTEPDAPPPLLPDDAAAPAHGQPGPSTGAPPPFEEREAPPPFSTEPVASTSRVVRLPTFLESETDDIFVPRAPRSEHTDDDDDGDMDALLHPDALPPPPAPAPAIAGEGTLFGFPASEQFDGHAGSDDAHGSGGGSSGAGAGVAGLPPPLAALRLDGLHDRVPSPPPTVEASADDPDVSALASFRGGPRSALEAMGRVLDQHRLVHGRRAPGGGGDGDGDAHDPSLPPPPPPPPLDDPSDPPPSIDSEFRTHGMLPPGLERPPGLPPSSPPPHDAHYASVPPPEEHHQDYASPPPEEHHQDYASVPPPPLQLSPSFGRPSDEMYAQPPPEAPPPAADTRRGEGHRDPPPYLVSPEGAQTAPPAYHD